MSWILIAIIAYFLLAVANIGDKLFLSGFVPNYKVYTSLVGIGGVVVFVIAPWYLQWPGTGIFVIALSAGVLSILALLAFFHSLQIGEASRVIPFIGGLVPVFTFLFSFLILGEMLAPKQLIAFLLLIVGTTLIVRLPHKTHWWDKWWERARPLKRGQEAIIASLAAALFAASFVSSKFVYEASDFLNGFLWVRLGSFAAVIFILFSKNTRKEFYQTSRRLISKTGSLFLSNQLFGAGGFFLQNVAISLGSVTLVNALQGMQYVFVIILAIIASFVFPKFSGEEEVTAKIVVEKVLAVAFIGAGLAVLAF